MPSAARHGCLCMEETNATPGGISLCVTLVPAARAIAPPAPTRRSDPALVVSPQRKGLWRTSSKVRVARDAETCDPPWGRTWRAGGKNTEGTEGSRRCTARPDGARSGREDAERTEGTDGDPRRVRPPDIVRVTEGRSSSPVPRSRPSERAPPRSLGGKDREAPWDRARYTRREGGAVGSR